MSSDQTKQIRYNRLFHKVRREGLERPAQGNLFIDAICAQLEPAQFINDLTDSPKGLDALQNCMRFKPTSEFLNQHATKLLKYLQDQSLKEIYGGELLQRLILKIVKPPLFWNEFIKAYKSGKLEVNAQQCFAWLLLELVNLPKKGGESDEGSNAYIELAQDNDIQDGLLNSTNLDIRTIGQKIKHILSNLIAPALPEDECGPGGRHDNDKVDFREITIFPTSDELQSKERPFLRLAKAIDDIEENQFAIHLDSQFRLLREDMMGEMREELHIALGFKKGKHKGIVANDFRMVGIDCTSGNLRDVPWGIKLECTKNDLPQFQGQKPAKRLDFIKNNRNIFRHNAQICVVVDGEQIAFPTINRNESLLAKRPPIVLLQFDGQASTTKALIKLRTGKNIKLVQIDTAIFAYEPVLRRLQTVKELPLGDQLFYKSNHVIHTSEFAPEHIIDLIEMDPTQDLKNLLGLQRSVKLDESQSDSLVMALRQKISLIQGPPGTGKSHVGSLLAKILHDSTDKTILVVCYTNHALDQFLEDILDVGIPGENMVRLGGKSTQKTKPLCLSEQQRGKYHQSYNVINSLKGDLKELKVRLEDAFDSYQKFRVMNDTLMEYLEIEELGFYQAFTIPEQEDGMKVVGKKKGRKTAAVNKYYLLEQWINGKDRGVFERSQFPDDESREIWQRETASRNEVFQKWINQLFEDEAAKVYSIGSEYNEVQERIDQMYKETDLKIIQEKRVVACTTTAAAKYVQQLQAAAPEIVLVEEAGEILESHVLTALGSKTEQLILIGDHQQLRPKVANYLLTVEKGEGYDLNRSLFERLVLSGFPHKTLIQQHRMRPEISKIVRNLTYPDLKDAPSTSGRPDLRGFQHNVVFVNHDYPEDENRRMAPGDVDLGYKSSKQNTYEARMVLKCVRYLGQNGYGTEKIVVLTPYLGQLSLLRDVLSHDNDPILNDLDSFDLVRAGLIPAASAKLSKRPILISTIDNYQGEERDIVLVTLTRSNTTHDIGFMAAPERLNVLISRARNALIMIGNAETFRNARNGREIWTKFFGMLTSAGQIHDGFPLKCERHTNRKTIITKEADFDDMCPDGGCTQPCGTVLNCTVHTCPQRCHQLYDHSNMNCEFLMKTNCSNAHPQQWKCYEGPPAACRKCDHDAKILNDKQQKDFAIQQKRDEEIRDHNRQMKLLDDKIEKKQQELKDKKARKDRERQLEQRKQDLKETLELSRSMEATAAAAAIASTSQSPPPTLWSTSQAPTSPPTTPKKISPKSSLPENSTPVQPNINKPASPTLSTAERAKHVPKLFKKYNSPSEQEWQRQKDMENANNSAIDAIMDMTGLESVKEQVLKIKSKIDVTVRQGTDLKDERFGVAMLGNPGTGKTTIARHYAKFLTTMGVLPGSEFVEKSGSGLANDGVSGVKKYIEDIEKAGGGVLFVDEAYQLADPSNGGTPVLDFLLAEIENKVGTIVFILAGYNKQMEKFFEHNPGIPSRIPYTLQFKDYEDYELLEMLRKKILKKFNKRMNIEDEMDGLYMRIVIRRLGRGRGKEGFGNARALENVLSKIHERQGERLTRERREGQLPNDFYFTKEDLIGPDPTNAIRESKEWKEIQGLIGLETVKESLRSMFDAIENNYRRELAEKEPSMVSLNRVFLGSPGTGKTSVAKLYGKVLADMGLLSNGEVVTKNPSDFTGDVLGASEKNTKSILETTIGKVLIIDEAYMLYSGGKTGGGQGDPYKTAVIDTIVAEVQSVPGEDRCVLLLGYEDQMREMFQNVNPGMSRRFAIDDAFHFQDFTISQLRQIMELKMKKQELEATEEAKIVACEVLGRARRRPNFGNGGEVENVLSKAKSRHQARQSKKPAAERPIDIIFEPVDFDPDFDRAQKAGSEASCRKLFEGMVNCESIIQQLEGYQQMAVNMKEAGLDPHEEIPTNFVFKGPPGTGKTTTARKMGQVYYDMGFLSAPDVVECSASDIVAQYVGHTGPLVQKQLEKGLGKVLFIDEAYRLREGPFAKEAIDELVDCVTKPKFAKKLIIILAGYDNDMNELMAVNAGLSSRFPEEVVFPNMPSNSCVQLLHSHLKKKKLSAPVFEDSTSATYNTILGLFDNFAAIPGWGNARDIITIAGSLAKLVYQSKARSNRVLSEHQVLDGLRKMLHEKQSRTSRLRVGPPPSPPQTQPQPQLPPIRPRTPPAPPAPPVAATATATKKASPPIRQPTTPPQPPTSNQTEARDLGVPDAIWAALTIAKAAASRQASEARAAQEKQRKLKKQQKEREAEIKRLAEKAKEDDGAKRRLEEARLREQVDRIAREKALREAEKAARKIREEAKVQAKLRQIGQCVAGFRWIKMNGGYRCAGGSHWVTDAQLGI